MNYTKKQLAFLNELNTLLLAKETLIFEKVNQIKYHLDADKRFTGKGYNTHDYSIVVRIIYAKNKGQDKVHEFCSPFNKLVDDDELSHGITGDDRIPTFDNPSCFLMKDLLRHSNSKAKSICKIDNIEIDIKVSNLHSVHLHKKVDKNTNKKIKEWRSGIVMYNC